VNAEHKTLTTWRTENLVPTEPFSFTAKADTGLDAVGVFRQHLPTASNSLVQQPLWDFAPAVRLDVVRERRRRFGVQEETGDPEYV